MVVDYVNDLGIQIEWTFFSELQDGMGLEPIILWMTIDGYKRGMNRHCFSSTTCIRSSISSVLRDKSLPW